MKTYTKTAREETGKAPDCTGALLEIKKLTRGAVKKADSEYVGCAQYVIQLQIVKPTGAAGMTVFDRIRVGVPEDPEAQKKSTWDVSEGGPARLVRLLKRAGVAMVEDDEEWMADAVGRTVVAPITNRGDFTNVGLYYRESDKDCPVIGLATGGGGGKAGPRATRPAEAEEEVEEESKPEVDEDEEPPKKTKKAKPAAEEEDEEDEEPPKKGKKPAKAEDDDEDEPPKKIKMKAKKPPVEEDEDED